MKNLINFPTSVFKPKYKIILKQVLSVLDCDKSIAKINFPHNKITILPDLPKPGEELMEIRIRDATVTYVLNKEQICVTGYLFLDNLSDLEGYLNACNKHFKIAGLGYWKYKVHYIELKKEEEFDSFLHFR